MVHGRDIVVQRIVHLSVQFDRIAVHEEVLRVHVNHPIFTLKRIG